MSRHRRHTPARGWVIVLAWVVGIGSAILILASPKIVSTLVSGLPPTPFAVPSEAPGISASPTSTPTSTPTLKIAEIPTPPTHPAPPTRHRSDSGAVISAFQDNVCTTAPGLARNARIVGCLVAQQFPGIMALGPGAQQYALLISVADAGTGIEVSHCLVERYQQWGLASITWAGQNYYQPGGWQVASPFAAPLPTNQIRVMLFENTMPDPLIQGCGK